MHKTLHSSIDKLRAAAAQSHVKSSSSSSSAATDGFAGPVSAPSAAA